jgi:integrase
MLVHQHSNQHETGFQMAKKDKVKFTDKWLQGLEGVGAAYAIGDAECKGLRIKVSAHGVRVFFYSYRSRVTGKPRDLRIGPYGDVTLAQARKRINETYRPAVEANPPRDPQEEKIEAREVAKAALPFDKLVPLFVADHLAKQRACGDRKQGLNRLGTVFEWAGRDPHTITEDEAKSCLTRLAAKGYENPASNRPIGGPTAAVYAQSLLGVFWDWMRTNKHVPVNIFRDLVVAAANRGNPRTRKLADNEIRTLFAECENPERFGYTRDAASALCLILCTASRTSMATGLLNHELVELGEPQPALNTTPQYGGLRVVSDDFVVDDGIELEANGPRAEFPHDRMKGRDDTRRGSRCDYVVPLSPRAVALIKSGTRYGMSGRVFGKGKSKGPRQGSHMSRSDVAGLMTAIWEKHGFPHATPRDLRRTATQLITSTKLRHRKRITTAEVGFVLNHSGENSVTRRHYDNGGIENPYENYDEKCEMIAILSARLDRILGGTAKPAIVRAA